MELAPQNPSGQSVTIEDQAWFWSKEWQAGEREAEADLAAGRCQDFESMEALLEDLGWIGCDTG